jgi:4-hydroxybenzoate polyprenyltransferase
VGRLARYLGLVKFEHTLFALPFALISLLVAADGRPAPRVLLWVLVAMVAARSAAMAFNRLADRRLDAANPRTRDRHLPTGAVSARGAAALVIAASALLVLAAHMLNDLCLFLSPVALIVVLGYSYTKRFTAASHLVLGLGLAIAPVGAWLAVTGHFAAFPLWTAAGVTFWVAGFDTIYGCQDADFDRRTGLHSLASRLGIQAALRLSRLFHLLAVACLAVAFTRPPARLPGGETSAALGTASLVGVGVMAGLLIWEQLLVRGGDLRRIRRAFFEINSWIGVVLLVAVGGDLYLF